MGSTKELTDDIGAAGTIVARLITLKKSGASVVQIITDSTVISAVEELVLEGAVGEQEARALTAADIPGLMPAVAGAMGQVVSALLTTPAPVAAPATPAAPAK